jgi:hypothetical protein
MLTSAQGSSTISASFASSALRRGATFAFVSFLAATALGAELPSQMPLGAWCPKQENIQTAALVEPIYVVLPSGNVCRHQSSIGMWCPEEAALFEPTHVLLPSGDVCRYKSTIGTWGNFLAEADCTDMPDGSRVSITWIGDTISFSGSIPGKSGEFKGAPIEVTLQRCPDDEPIFVAD